MWNMLIERWRVCLSLAWQSYCEGSVPIGSVVVDSEGNILSQGRNKKSVSLKSDVP